MRPSRKLIQGTFVAAPTGIAAAFHTSANRGFFVFADDGAKLTRRQRLGNLHHDMWTTTHTCFLTLSLLACPLQLINGIYRLVVLALDGRWSAVSWSACTRLRSPSSRNSGWLESPT